MGRLPPSEDVGFFRGLWRDFKLWLYENRVIEQASYENVNGGTTYLRRQRNKVGDLFSKPG